MLWAALRVFLLFAVRVVHVNQYPSTATPPMTNFEVIKSGIVRRSSGIYFEFEVSNPLVCVDPYITFTLGMSSRDGRFLIQLEDDDVSIEIRIICIKNL